MAEITREERKRLRALDDEGTPAPWFVQQVPGSNPYVAAWCEHEGEKLRTEPDTDDDLALTAAARNALIPLLDEIDRLDQRVAEAKGEETRIWAFMEDVRDYAEEHDIDALLVICARAIGPMPDLGRNP